MPQRQGSHRRLSISPPLLFGINVLSESPYQPPNQLSQVAPEDSSDGYSADTFLPFAQLGLRLLGVMFVLDGVSAIFGGLFQGLMQARAYVNAGYGMHVDPHSVGWAAGGIPHIVVGLYLTIGGNWVLQKVFTAAQRSVDGSPENGTSGDAPN